MIKINKYDDNRLKTLTLEQQANYVSFLYTIVDLPQDKLEEVMKELVWQNIKLREGINEYADEITELTGIDPRTVPPTFDFVEYDDNAW